MKVVLNRKEFALEEGATVAGAMKAASLSIENFLVTRGGRLVHESEPLKDGDALRTINVVSGG